MVITDLYNSFIINQARTSQWLFNSSLCYKKAFWAASGGSRIRQNSRASPLSRRKHFHGPTCLKLWGRIPFNFSVFFESEVIKSRSFTKCFLQSLIGNVRRNEEQLSWSLTLMQSSLCLFLPSTKHWHTYSFTHTLWPIRYRRVESYSISICV